MIQTVEEAAKQWDETQFGKITLNTKIELTEEKHSQFLAEAFVAGAAWQKEKGIEWIPIAGCEDLPSIGEYVLILLEGETFLKGRRKYKTSDLTETIWTAIFLDGESPCADRTITHFAYVNLPKTNK